MIYNIEIKKDGLINMLKGGAVKLSTGKIDSPEFHIVLAPECKEFISIEFPKVL